MADDAPAPRSGASDYRWQSQPARSMPAAAGGSRRGRWLFVLAALFLAFLSTVIVWVLLIKPPPAPPYYLSINIADYNVREYPPIAFTKQDGERILRHFPAKNQAVTKTKKLLREELKGLTGRSDPLIIHITALALARDGKVFLLPGDALPDTESTWLEIHEVLNAVADCPAQEKLLILDLAHPLADPRRGVLFDRVAQTLDEILSSEKPPFPVLCACSAQQVSLRSEALQASVLGYYLDQGLQGNADVNKDLRVKLRELCAFVEARVDRWAQNNYAVTQKPRLFGTDQDFDVVSVARDGPPEFPSAVPEAYPERVQKAWQERDLWWNREAFRRAPRLLRKIDANLLRQDRQLRGGVLHKKDLESQEDETQGLLKEIARAMTFPSVPPRSLALVLTQSGATKDPAFADAVLNLLANTKAVVAKKDVNAKVEEELVKKLRDAKDVVFPQQAWALLEALNRVPQLKPEHFRVARETLAEFKADRQFVELLYVQRLIDFAERKDADAWQPKKVLTIFQAMRARSSVIASLEREPEVLPWLGRLIEEADELRRVGERKLLWERPSTWEDGYEKLQSAKGKYDEAQRVFELLQRGRWNLDRAFAELPAYIDLVCGAAEFDAQAEQTWMKALDEAEKLQAFFGDRPAPGASAGKDHPEVLALDGPARELQRHLLSLEKTLKRRIERAENEENLAAAQWQLLLLLDSPLLKAPDRARILAKQRALATKLNDANDRLDKDDNHVGRVLAPAGADRPTRDRTAGLARARMSAALLRLAGGSLAKRKFLLPAAEANLSSPEWANLERKLQTAWSNDLVAQWRKPGSAFAVDTLNRLVSPWELANKADVSGLWQMSLRESFRQWLRERYQAEARFLESGGQDPQLAVFYGEAAKELTPR